MEQTFYAERRFMKRGNISGIFGDLVIEYEDENNDGKEKVGKFP